MSNLYVVATPIGNLEDIGLRALEILKSADLVLAEDTRVTSKLLARYDIHVKELISYHQHSTAEKTKDLLNKIVVTDNTVLVSDAGTPGINDPGNMLISEIIKARLPIKIIPIPGPNAAITALSITGFPTDTFIFLGFPPHKKGRKTFFEKLAQSEVTTVFYESPFRILKALTELPQDRQVVICRELTKKFETIYRGKVSEIKIPENEIKGEFVVVVKGN